jgi:hypothetical protein
MTIDGEYGHGVGDVNGEGSADLVVYGGPSSRLGFVGWYGPFTGSMGVRAPDVAQYQSETVGGYSKEVYAGGDLNGDGLDEIVFASPSSQHVSGAWGQVAVYDGSALSGALDNSDAATTLYGSGGQVYFGAVVDIGDADGDGLDDLAIATARNSVGTPEPTYIWASDGLATAAAQDIETVAMATLHTEGELDSTAYTSLSLRDVDADGQSDLGYSWYTNNGTTVVWFLDLPGGGATRTEPDVTWSRSTYGYAKVDDVALDTDGDGAVEQAFVLYPDVAVPPVYAFLSPAGFADGTIDPEGATWAAAMGEPFRWSALAADLDGDGDTELLPWDADASVGGSSGAGGFQVLSVP